jgi:agmatinase
MKVIKGGIKMVEYKKYHPEDPSVITRYTGIRTFMKLPYIKDDLNGADFAIIGIACDGGTTFRSGAAFGPSAIREMSIMLRNYNINLDIDIFEYLSGVDYGDANTNPCSLQASLDATEQIYDEVVSQGVLPIGLGGDHAVTLGELRSVAKKHGPVALVQFDSHPDTYDVENGSKLTHGTIFRRGVEEGIIDAKHSIQVGIRGVFDQNTIAESEGLGYTVITAAQMHDKGLDWTAQRILEVVGDTKTHLTFDIDFFDPAYAPGTGTVEVGGFTSFEGIKLMRNIKDINFVSFDVVEVLPSFDPTQITAYLAGSVVHEFLAILASKKREAGKR